MKIIRGTQDAKGRVFQKQPEGGTGRMRCMKCSCLMTNVVTPDGKSVIQCGGCGAMHTTAGMDKKYTPPPGTVPRRKTP